MWPDFKNHVLGENPDLVETWHVIGWYPNIRKYDRNFSNISDGGVFSSLEKAKQYVKEKRISILRIEALFLPVDDLQIDFYTLSFDEQKQRLEK